MRFPFRSLRDWMEFLEEKNDLVYNDKPVNTEGDISAISRRIAKEDGPAMIHNNIEGYPGWRVFSDGLAARRRQIWAVNIDPDTAAQTLAEKLDKSKPVKPKLVDDGPCKEIKILKGDFRTHLQLLLEQHIQFQAIYTNPPLKLGHDLMLELFEGAMQLLTPTGYIQYVHKKKLGAPGFLKKLQTLQPDWFFRIVKKKAGYHVIVLSPVEFDVEDTSQGYGGYF